jgi:hypothetical protein
MKETKVTRASKPDRALGRNVVGWYNRNFKGLMALAAMCYVNKCARLVVVSLDHDYKYSSLLTCTDEEASCFCLTKVDYLRSKKKALPIYREIQNKDKSRLHIWSVLCIEVQGSQKLWWMALTSSLALPLSKSNSLKCDVEAAAPVFLKH